MALERFTARALPPEFPQPESIFLRREFMAIQRAIPTALEPITYAMLPTGSGSWDTGSGTTITITRALTVTGTLTGGTVALGTNPATTGLVRLPNNNDVYGRNAANSGNVHLIAVNASDQVSIAAGGAATVFGGGVVLPTGKTITFDAAGGDAVVGNAVLVGGTVTVNTTAVTANSKILLTHKTAGGTPGIVDYTINAGTSFTITSSNALDTSTYTFLIVEG